jgi:hypothetical protein
VLCYDFCCSEKEPNVWECLRLNIEQRNKLGRKPEKERIKYGALGTQTLPPLRKEIVLEKT